MLKGGVKISSTDPNTGETVYNVDIPKYNANERYLADVFQTVEHINQVASTLTGYNDIRFNALITLLINKILNKTARSELIAYRQNEILKRCSTDKLADENHRIIFEINIETVGEFMTWLSRFMSLEEKLEVMRIARRKQEDNHNE